MKYLKRLKCNLDTAVRLNTIFNIGGLISEPFHESMTYGLRHSINASVPGIDPIKQELKERHLTCH